MDLDTIKAMKNNHIPLYEVQHKQVVVNSSFIATLAPVCSTGEARNFISRMKMETVDASHNVPAYFLGGGNSVSEYFSDDGEPAGTAGRPALTVLRGNGLGDIVVVITRYFGGNLLGTGGLAKAYTESSHLVVNAGERGRRLPVHMAMAAILAAEFLATPLLLCYNYFSRCMDECGPTIRGNFLQSRGLLAGRFLAPGCL